MFGAATVKNGMMSCLGIIVFTITILVIIDWAGSADVYDWLKLSGIILLIILMPFLVLTAISYTDSHNLKSPEKTPEEIAVDEFNEVWKAFGQIAHRVDDQFMQRAWVAYDAQDIESLRSIYEEAQNELNMKL